jgi:hypothetical protein
MTKQQERKNPVLLPTELLIVINMILIIFAAPLLAVEAHHKSTFTLLLQVDNQTGAPVTHYPLLWQAEQLPAEITPTQPLMTDDAGHVFPAQLDNCDIKDDNENARELSALIPLKPGINRFSVKFEADAKVLSADSPFHQTLSAAYMGYAVDNGQIRMRLNNGIATLNKQFLDVFHDEKWQQIAGKYYETAIINNARGQFKPIGAKIDVPVMGPVHAVLRRVVSYENKDGNQTYQYIQEWHFFKNLPAILMRRTWRNTSASAMSIQTVTTGYYDVTPLQKDDAAGQSTFAIEDRTGVRDGDLGNQKVNSHGAWSDKTAAWGDIYSGDDAERIFGLGLIYPHPEDVAMDIFRVTDGIRLSVTEGHLQSSKPVMIWPDKTDEKEFWLLAHGGDYSVVQQWARQCSQIHVTALGLSQSPADGT